MGKYLSFFFNLEPLTAAVCYAMQQASAKGRETGTREHRVIHIIRGAHDAFVKAPLGLGDHNAHQVVANIR